MAASKSWRIAAVSLSLLISSTVAADEPYLVRDIVPGSGPQLDSQPVLVKAGQRMFLFHHDEDHGRELWITDGTPEGTRLVRDICPGECWSDPVWQWSLGNRLLFSARSSFEGPHRLWISDGTFGGTRPLGSGSLGGSSAVGFLEDRGLFFFSATDGGEEEGLWVSDGTAAGTAPIGTGGPDGWPLYPYGGSTGQGPMVFAGQSDDSYEPWVSDGTTAGTRLLAELAPPEGVAILGHFRNLGGVTVFFNESLLGPCETVLWRSDGTVPGTFPLTSFDDPECSRILVTPVLDTDDAAYFIAGDGGQPRQLWRTDGTRAGTRPLTSFTAEAFDDRRSYPDRMAREGGSILFAADDGVTGAEPWVADAGGVRRIADLCPGTCSSSPTAVRGVGGRFYFFADDGVHGLELHTSDGTPGGTRLVGDLCPGSCSAPGFVVGAAGGRVFYVANDGSTGRELWSAPVGGTGAVRVTDFAPSDPFPFSSTFSSSFEGLGNAFLFTADDGEHGLEIWRSDGTPEGTGMLVDLETRREPGAGSNPIMITPWDHQVLFFANEPDVGYQPWISDGSAGGTRRLGIVSSSDPLRFPPPYAEPVVLGDFALLLAERDDEGPLEIWRVAPQGEPTRLLELPGGGDLGGVRTARIGSRAAFFIPSSPLEDGGVWVSDGSAAGTRQIEDLELLDLGPRTTYVGELGGELYFAATADRSSRDYELWATDGTVAGTRLVREIEPGPTGSEPAELARLGGRLFFAATTDAAGRELWETDGTTEGTRLFADLRPGFAGSDPRALTPVGNRLFFLANDPVGFPALWVTDGTGTSRLAPVSGLEIFPRELPKRAGAAGRFFFIVRGNDGSSDLWVSDGTVNGTGSLRPLLAAGASPLGVWSAGDRVLVSVEHLSFGHELWETDGTFAGTRRLFRLPLPFFSAPISYLAQVGSLLYFSGPHPEAGPELMALPLGPPAPCSADAGTLCLRNNRFAVRAKWRDPRSGDSGTAGALPMPGSDRTGLFWFFAPDNVELVVKTLDGGGVNGFFWNFYGALSDVEYEIEVTDTATGRRVEYFNPGGEICGLGDTTAFPARPPVPLPVPPEPVAAPVRSAAASGVDGTACGGSADDLCLLGGRFRVEVEWSDPRSGDSGAGTAVPYADRSGFFWFFEPQNVELVVKILDGRNVNGRFWVFYGALSDVEYTIRVTDTETGAEATYHNPPGEICGRGDTAAF